MSALDQLVKPYDDGSISELQEQAAVELATLRAVVEAARKLLPQYKIEDGKDIASLINNEVDELTAALAAYDKVTK